MVVVYSESIDLDITPTNHQRNVEKGPRSAGMMYLQCSGCTLYYPNYLKNKRYQCGSSTEIRAFIYRILGAWTRTRQASLSIQDNRASLKSDTKSLSQLWIPQGGI